MKKYIKRVNGWKKNRGSTLVELVSVISISLVIMTISINLLFVGIKNVNKLYGFIKVTCEIDDALLNIERLLSEMKINEIKVIAGDCSTIMINSDEGKGDIKKKNTLIYYEDNKLKVRRDKYFVETNRIDTTGINTILNNVNTFEIYKKGKLYYMYIKHESGLERIVCL